MAEKARTVVIVDDEPITRMDLSELLRDLGFAVIAEAGDGFDAIELCRERHPDVVLMDAKMPIFDGLTAAETIVSESLAGCVVLLTAFQDREIAERAGRIGITGYLVKPVDAKALLPTIEIALAQNSRLRQSQEQAQIAENKIREDRLVHRAQRVLMEQLGCTEAEAYHKIRRMAMDKRITVAVLAERVLQQYEKK